MSSMTLNFRHNFHALGRVALMALAFLMVITWVPVAWEFLFNSGARSGPLGGVSWVASLAAIVLGTLFVGLPGIFALLFGILGYPFRATLIGSALLLVHLAWLPIDALAAGIMGFLLPL